MEGRTAAVVSRKRGRESWGGKERKGGEREEGEDRRRVRVSGMGLKKRGPNEGTREVCKRRGGACEEEIGHSDFHSSEKSIVLL